MASQPTGPAGQAVQDAYPFPLAFVFQEAVMEAPDAERRVRGIIQTFTAGIQYAALICASEYARANYQDEHLSWSLERLKRPLVSDFFHFVTAAVTSLQQHGVAPLVSELEAFAAQMEQMRVTVPVMVDNVPCEQSLLLRKALVELRNTLGHKLYRANWPQLAKQYLPHLRLFLQTMDWCTRYPPLRVVGNGQMVRLMGATLQFVSEPIPDAALEELARAQREEEFTGLLLADVSLTRFLNLYPLVLVEPCAECQAELLRGLTEEVFLFNGDEGRYLVYLGVRHSRNTERHRDAVDALYANKKVAPPVIRVSQITAPELLLRSQRQAERGLDTNIAARRYLPQVYQPRPEMDAALRAFLRSHRVGFCLLGEAGIGKTSLLCRKVEEWSGRRAHSHASEEASGDIVLFYEGRGLFAQGGLEERILKDLYLEGSFLDLLNRLRPTGLRLMLVIDGVNEDESPSRTLQALCQFIIRWTGKGAGVKVVFSFRSAFLDKTLRALGYTGEGDEMRDLFPHDAFFTREEERQGRKMETYRFVLDRVSVEEAEALYEAYRQFEGMVDEETGKVQRFCPLTSFASLSLPTRHLLTHPWYLRMVLEAFDARRVPESLWVGELLEEFCRAKTYGRTRAEQELFDDRAAFVEGLVQLMREQRTDTVQRGDPNLPTHLAQAVAERQVALSPYLQLVDEGVLMEVPETEAVGRRTRTRYFIRFAFDPLFEYLLSEDILREMGGWEKLTGKYLAALLEEGKEFDHLTGAVELLLTEAAQQGNFDLLIATINASGEPTSAPVFVHVLITLEGIQHSNFEPLLDALVEQAEGGKALTVLINASRDFNEKRQFRPTLVCIDRAERVSERLIEQEGCIELDLPVLAIALGNKAKALTHLRRLSEAVACCDKVIAIFDQLTEERRTEFAETLANALMNKGVALRWLGRLAEAGQCQDAAIAVFKRLMEKGRTEFAKDLAGAKINKGSELHQLGRLAEAIVCYDEAIATFKQLMEEQGRQEPADASATAFMNKGLALAHLGRLSEAVACHNEAVATLKQLVEKDGREELIDSLARALVNKALALKRLGDPLEEAVCYEAAIAIYRQLIDKGRGELAIDLAIALDRKGKALQQSGRLDEAVACYDEAIATSQQLVKQEGFSSFAGGFAEMLSNKGVGLTGLGRRLEAVGCYDEAIAVYDRLIKEEGRAEFAENLATVLINKGNTMPQLGRYEEAIECYDEAIIIRKQLVEDENRKELANDLATALENRGVVLAGLRRMEEAVTNYDAALSIRKRLVEEQSSLESASALAQTLMKKGVALQVFKRFKQAVECYDEAIHWQDNCLQAGMFDLLPEVLRTLRFKTIILLNLGNWDSVAADSVRVLIYTRPFVRSGSVPELVRQEFTAFFQQLHALSIDKRVQLYAALGEWADVVRGLIETAP